MLKVDGNGPSPRLLLFALIGAIVSLSFMAGDSLAGFDAHRSDEIRFLGRRMPRPGSAAAAERSAGFGRIAASAAGRERQAPSSATPPTLDAWTTNGVMVCNSPLGAAIPSVTSDGSGGAIVGWIDPRNGGFDLYCNRLDSNGDFPSGWNPSGVAAMVRDSFLVLCEVQTDGSGGAFLTSSEYRTGASYYHDVFVQHMLGNGTLSSGWTLAGRSMNAGDIGGFATRPDGAGGLFVGWLDAVDQARVVRIDGAGDLVSGWPAAGLPIAPAATYDIDLVGDGAGGAYFAWATNDSIMAIRYNASGVLATGWPAAGKVLESGGFTAAGVRLAVLTSGDLMATWEDFRNFDYDLFAVRIAPDATFPSPWAANGVPVCTATGSLYDAVIASDGAGGATIAWNDQRSGTGTEIYAIRITGAGALATGWTSDGTLMMPSSPSANPQVFQADGSGGVFLSWVDVVGSSDGSDDVFVQHLQGDGSRPAMFPAGGLRICDAPNEQAEVAMATDGAGGSILCWDDSRNLGAGPPTIYAARIQSDGTVAAQASLASASAEPGLVRLLWFSPDGASFRATLERERAHEGFVAIATLGADAGGFVRYEDQDVVAGETYRYRLVVVENGARTVLGAVTLVVPNGLTLAIEPARPNPSAGPVTLAFTLPSSAPATLELLDVAGRRVLSREIAAVAGRQLLRLDSPLAPGVYAVRLAQAGRVATSRIVVTE